MDKSVELAQALAKTLNYTKNLKLNVGMQPMQQSSETVLSHDYPLSAAAFHKSKKKDSAVLSRDSSPRAKQKRRSKQKDAFNMSCKYPVLKKEFQSQNQRDTTAFNRTTDKVEIKHLTNLLGGSIGSKQFLSKKSGHSYTYTHLNDDSDKFSQADGSFSIKPQQKIAKFRHSKSPSKERHIEHNNTSYAQENYSKVTPPNRPAVRVQVQRKGGNDAEMGALMKEISRLQGIIQSYQAVLLQLKHKYLQLEDKLAEKAMNDHYIDVLKKKLEELQENNHKLKGTIEKQRLTISRFQSIFAEKIGQIRQHYQASTQNNTQLARQNEFLKRVMMIAANPEHLRPKTEAEQQPTPNSTTKETPANAYLKSMSRSVEQFSSKWK